MSYKLASDLEQLQNEIIQQDRDAQLEMDKALEAAEQDKYTKTLADAFSKLSVNMPVSKANHLIRDTGHILETYNNLPEIGLYVYVRDDFIAWIDFKDPYPLSVNEISLGTSKEDVTKRFGRLIPTPDKPQDLRYIDRLNEITYIFNFDENQKCTRIAMSPMYPADIELYEKAGRNHGMDGFVDELFVRTKKAGPVVWEWLKSLARWYGQQFRQATLGGKVFLVFAAYFVIAFLLSLLSMPFACAHTKP